MNQKVKLQLNSDLSDVPRLCGFMLHESEVDAASLQGLLAQISGRLKHVSLSSEQDLDKLKRELENMDAIRILLMKIDSRVGDIASIIGGLHEALTSRPQQQNEEQKVEENDSIAAG